MEREHAEPVELVMARDPFHAKIIVATLEEAGIQAFTDGGNLQDEFAISQRLLGTGGVRVWVAADRVEDAERALAEAKEAGKRLEEAFGDDGESDEPE